SFHAGTASSIEQIGPNALPRGSADRQLTDLVADGRERTTVACANLLNAGGSDRMATAVVEERQLLKTLRWWDGFTIALCNPGFLLGSLGYTLGIFGVVGSIVLWG